MTNLATLIGAKNLELLIADDTNTYVVLDDNGVYKYAKNSNEINFGEVVGIGSFKNCYALANYLNIGKLAS